MSICRQEPKEQKQHALGSRLANHFCFEEYIKICKSHKRDQRMREGRGRQYQITNATLKKAFSRKCLFLIPSILFVLTTKLPFVEKVLKNSITKVLQNTKKKYCKIPKKSTAK